MSRHLFVLIFEPGPGTDEEVDRILKGSRERAEASGWHCWAYRNDLKANEITLFLEGPRREGADTAIFGTEIQDLRSLATRFEPVRSLSEYPLEDPK